MKVYLVLLSLVAVVLAKTLSETRASQWKKFKLDFSRSFESPKHEKHRENIFWNSVKTISRHNFEFRQGRKLFTMGINGFSDMTFEEYSALFKANETIQSMAAEKAKGIKFRPKIMYGSFNSTKRDFPTSFDWREHGAVTKVKDQKTCGSCYAMGAIGSIESQYFIKHKKLIELSTQEIVDCGGNHTTFGCSGGISFRVYDYVKENHISTATDYPYKGKVGECRPVENKIKIHLKGYGFVFADQDSDNLAEAVSKFGPIFASINSDHESFMRYSGGIYYNEECTDQINHAVLIVGYGSDDGKDYWLVKNSFGEAWGESGYVKMSRNMGSDCGILGSPLFPIIK